MKKLSFLFVLLSFLSVPHIYPQGTNKRATPIVRLGTIPSFDENKNSTIHHVTLKEFQANSKLVVVGSNCKVEEFTFGIFPTGRDFIGPFTVKGSDEFTPEIKRIIAGLDPAGGRAYIESIKLNCGGNIQTARSILITYK